MSPPSYMAYLMIGGVVVISLLTIPVLGAEAWVVPAVVIPLTAIYAVYDRRLYASEKRRSNPTEGSEARST